jgi:hypothetical protein
MPLHSLKDLSLPSVADSKRDATALKLMEKFHRRLLTNQNFRNQYRHPYLQLTISGLQIAMSRSASSWFRSGLVVLWMGSCIVDIRARTVTESVADENGAIDETQTDSESGQDPVANGLPPSASFEAKIMDCKDVQSKVEEMKSTIKIGSLRINALPIKQALSTWTSKWIHTSFLQNQIKRQLCGLDGFINKVRSSSRPNSFTLMRFR